MRLSGIDRLRGLAILLMIGDHVAAVDGDWMWYRFTLGRAALPLFMLLLGALQADREVKDGRVAKIGACGAFCSLLASYSPPFDSVDILAVIAVVLLCWPVINRWPLWAAFVGAVSGYTFQGAFYDGYGLAYVGGLAALGVVLRRQDRGLHRLDAAGSGFPSWLGWLGRRALVVYVVHLTALWAWEVEAWQVLSGLSSAS